ncbi:MAG: ribosome recycling factor [Desulfuromonadaceae bacterium]|nr:ribosome recycling factor [Desulfuromonadaceae bacterium]
MFADVKQKCLTGMEKTIEVLKKDFGKVRTGRASVTLLEDIVIDYYGNPTPINQVGTLAAPEPRLITIQPWEKKLIGDIEKAILKSDLGLNPDSDGQIIRIAIPPLTEERRREMAKMVRKMGEEAKIILRNLRRDANERMKKMEKNKELTKDDLKRGEKEIQDLTDAYVKKTDDLVVAKENEIMEI